MPQEARVYSIDTIRQFRARVCVFVEQARAAVSEMQDEYNRGLRWVREERPAFWRHELRVRTARLGEARANLNRARLSAVSPHASTDERAVEAARRAVAEAEMKLANLQRWGKLLETRAAPHVAQLWKLNSVLDREFARALSQLDQVLTALEAYAESQPQQVRETPTDETPGER